PAEARLSLGLIDEAAYRIRRTRYAASSCLAPPAPTAMGRMLGRQTTCPVNSASGRRSLCGSTAPVPPRTRQAELRDAEAAGPAVARVPLRPRTGYRVR